MKKALLALLYIIFSLLAVSCESVPFKLDALEAEVVAAKAAVPADPKRVAKAEKRLERFETVALKAELHFANREACKLSSNHIWFCKGREHYNTERPPEDVDALVRVYRRDQCGCMTKDTLRELLRNL